MPVVPVSRLSSGSTPLKVDFKASVAPPQPLPVKEIDGSDAVLIRKGHLHPAPGGYGRPIKGGRVDPLPQPVPVELVKPESKPTIKVTDPDDYLGPPQKAPLDGDAASGDADKDAAPPTPSPVQLAKVD